jgi:hypothetical protein
MFGKGRKYNWVIVSHYFFVSSRKFEHEFITDATEKEAEAYAALEQKKKDESLMHCAVEAIRLPDYVEVKHTKQTPTE